jgi:polyisoprenoid-binding protein YceI
MKIRILALASLVLALGMTSCGDTEEVDPAEGGGEKEICVYSYSEGTTDFEWTSYKTNAKKPVAGTFNEITVESESSDDPMKVIKSLSFKMNTASVETNDEGRNAKVAEFFFGTINTPEITGKVASINEDAGKASISVMMNGISFDVEGDYTFEDGKFSWSSTIDVSSWNGMPGIEALNTECKDLHTGDDGVSKLWSEVALSFSTTLSSDCDE